MTNPERIAQALNDRIMEPQIPAIGWHLDTPMREYLEWDAISNSGLTQILRSPAHYKAYRDEPLPDTPALTTGRAVHAAILEPEMFDAYYARGPAGDRRTKAIKAEWAQLEGEYGEGAVLRPQDYDNCLWIRDAVHANTTAHNYLSGPGDNELSVVWERDGVRCKARIDRLVGAVIDLKTTQDARRSAFERAIYGYGYHRQAAFYREALALHIKVPHIIIAAEKVRPFAVSVYQLDEDSVAAGEIEIATLMERYAACKRLDQWPGYPDGLQTIGLPPWALETEGL